MQGREQVQRIRAILIDDQLVFRLGLRLYLSETMPELDLVGEASSAKEGLAMAGRERPDLVLLDAFIKGRQTHALVAQLSRLLPECRLVLLASLPDAAGLALAMDAGAHGCMLKTSAHECLPAAISAVLNGANWVQPELAEHANPGAGIALDGARSDPSPSLNLTPRQREVLRLVALGLSNADIASRLFISKETVKSHIAQLLRRLGVRTRVQAARYAIRRGLGET